MQILSAASAQSLDAQDLPASALHSAVVEDLPALRVVVRTLFRRHHERLGAYALGAELQLSESGPGLVSWLATQPLARVGLLILDYQLKGSSIMAVLPALRAREPAPFQHPALHPRAVLVGWSIHSEAAALFRDSGVVDAFISKHRPAQNLIDDLLLVLEHRRARQSWLELS
jgi:CheY-like chemotaxis protein